MLKIRTHSQNIIIHTENKHFNIMLHMKHKSLFLKTETIKKYLYIYIYIKYKQRHLVCCYKVFGI